MKNIQQFDTFDLSEGYYDKASQNIQPGGGPKLSKQALASLWKEKFNPKHQDLYNDLIQAARSKNGGEADPEDLLAILTTFDLLSETPEESLAVYKMLDLENPNFKIHSSNIGPHSPQVKAAMLMRPHLDKLGASFNIDDMFSQGKLDF